MEIVGCCYFGCKVVLVGGGGGSVLICELFDMLLLWNLCVMFDVNGSVIVEVLLNDVFMCFWIVVIVVVGFDCFGMGSMLICSM